MKKVDLKDACWADRKVSSMDVTMVVDWVVQWVVYWVRVRVHVSVVVKVDAWADW